MMMMLICAEALLFLVCIISKYATPSLLSITDDRNEDGYVNGASVSITSGRTHKLTCLVQGARPPAVLEWQVPEEVQIRLEDQYNAVYGDAYTSQRVVSVTPSRNDDGKIFRCVALHRELDNEIQLFISLDVQVSPNNLRITASEPLTIDEAGRRSVNVFEYSITPLTCKSTGSRPTALIVWTIGSDDDLGSTTTKSTTNEVDEGLRDTQSTLELIPKRRHHNKLLRCVAYAGMNQRQLEVRLIVYGPPDCPYLNGTDGLQAGVSSNVTCTSNNGYPAPTFQWYLGSKNVTKDYKTQFSRNRTLLRDASSVFNFTPTVAEHGKVLVCQAFQLNAAPMKPWSVSEVLHVLYSPVIVNYFVRRVSRGLQSVDAILTCTSDSRPLASITWFSNGTELNNGTRHHIFHSLFQEDTLRQSILIISHISAEDEGIYTCLAESRLGNDSATITFSYSVIPDPPSRFFVDQDRTLSSTLFVSWQPGFDGGLQQTFTLEYCLNDTQVEGCGVVTNLTGTSHTLLGLVPFTWYRMTLRGVNSAGNSSAEEPVVASTSPLQPESYGVTTRWDKQKHILTLSEANQTLDEICFITLRNYSGPDCASVNGTECVEPGTEITIDPDGDTVLVTYGRGLCSKPADLKDSPVEKQPSTARNLPYMIIAIGVIASAGFILLISLGLMYFYGVLCSVKRNKDNGKHNQPEGQMVDQGEYAEISQVPPSHASKPTTSDYMDLKPVPHTNKDTTTSDYMNLKPVPRTNNDTTTSYYVDLKPVPRADNDTTTSDYMDLKPIPRTNNDTTTSYYMDLKPVPRTNKDTTTSYYMDMKPISPTDNEEYISPSATRKCPEAVYVNRDMTDESALHNNPDNQDCKS